MKAIALGQLGGRAHAFTAARLLPFVGVLVLSVAGCGTWPQHTAVGTSQPVHSPLSSVGPAGSERGAPAAGEATKSASAHLAASNGAKESTPGGSTTAFYREGSGVFTGRLKSVAVAEQHTGKITLNFENTDIREVVKAILGDLLKENYAIDSRVQGKVTLQTSRPLAREALLPTLEMVLRMNGATFVREDGVYRVVPRGSALAGGGPAPQLGNTAAPLPHGYSVQVVPLRYIAATQMQKILAPFAGPGNIVRVDSERNLLILAGSANELGRLLDTIDIFDVDWLRGMSVGLFTPTFVDAQTLAKDLDQIFGEKANTPLAGLVRLIPIKHLNALLVITPRPQYLHRVAAWVKRLDRSGAGTGRQLFVYHVQNGRATDIAAVLNEVFGQQPAGGLPPPELAPGLRPALLQSPSTQPPPPTPAGMGSRQRLPEAQSAAEPPASASEAASLPEHALEPTSATPPFAAAGLAGAAGPKASSRAGAPGEGLAISEKSGLRIIPDEVNNALVVLATPEEYRQVEAALHKLDTVPLQVLIEVTIAEITLTGDLRYGLEWFFTHDLGKYVSKVQLDLGKAGIGALVPGFSYAIADSAGVVRAVLNSLASDSRLNVVSSPSLVVLNNQTAHIQVGDEVPIVTQEQQATVAQSTLINTIEYRKTGVLLSVTPRVNAGGLVTMDVEQEVSDVAPGSQNSVTPTIQQRKISSTVAVQSGQTVVLGGLIRENKSVESSGIPGLYKLPIIGPLFGETSNSHKRTELVVLITPRAIQNAEEARQVTEEFRDKMESLKPLTERGSAASSLLRGKGEAPDPSERPASRAVSE